MKIIEGHSIVDGIAIGKLCIRVKKKQQISFGHITDADAEVARFLHAADVVKMQFAGMQEKALAEVDNESAMIFEAQGMLLDDVSYIEFVTDTIRNRMVNTEYAVKLSGDHFIKMFAKMEDAYLRERATDVGDVCRRLFMVLACEEEPKITLTEPAILYAENLMPSDVLGLDKTKILGIVTKTGTANSHAAILARSRNIPMISGVEADRFADIADELAGKAVILDGFEGNVIIEPTEEQLAEYEQLKEDAEQEKKALLTLMDEDNCTIDGEKIDLYANADCIEDVEGAFANGAGGIGLFRSEFLYLESEDYPTEEAQFEVYRTVARKMGGRKVIIRTMDIGSDKQAHYFAMEKEENPALGYRGIRVCLDRLEIFKTQLRAIYRASVYGDIAVMFPMIISVSEVHQIKQMIAEVKRELAAEGVPYKDCEIGIMIETPAAAMISDLLAEEVDFFSVGTNDLTQYTLAIDRQNAKLADSYDGHHEAILRMLRLVVDNGHRSGCRVGICGELAADTTLTETLLKMGFDEFSVSPSLLLSVRAAIRESRIDEEICQ